MMTYKLDNKNGVIHLKASGVLIKEDPISYFNAIDQDENFKAKAEERIYFKNLKDIKLSYLDVQEIVAAFKKYKHAKKITKGIFIVDSNFSYGMARMIVTIFEPLFNKFEIERK